MSTETATPVTATKVTKAANYLTVGYDVLGLYPHNPRKDLGDIKALAATIIGAGRVLKALSGFNREGQYQVVDGQRRLAALKLIKEQGGNDHILAAVPFEVITEGTSEVELSFRQMLSNEGAELKPLELAEEIKRLKTDWDLKPGEIAEKLGKSKVYVNELIRLADLPDHVKKLINNGTLSATLVRNQMRNGGLEEFIASLGSGTEEGEVIEGEEVTPKASTKQAAITAKDTEAGVNSLKEFKRFAKAFTELFPEKKSLTIQEVYEVITDILHNKVDYNFFLTLFTDDSTKDSAIKAPKAAKVVDIVEGQKEVKATKKSKAEKQAALATAPAGDALAPGAPEGTPATEAPKKAAKKAAVKAAEQPVEPTAKAKGSKAKVEAKTDGKAAPKGTTRKIGFDKKAK